MRGVKNPSDLIIRICLTGKNRVRSQNYCPNLKFRQLFLFEFKSGLDLGLDIWVRGARISELFQIRTNSDNQTIKFVQLGLCVILVPIL